MSARALAPLALFVLGACATAPPVASPRQDASSDAPRPAPQLELPGDVDPSPASAPSPGSAEEAEAARTPVLGTIAGETITADDLLLAWHALSPRDLWLVVDKLVATRLARAEAGRLGVTLAPEVVEGAVARERERLAASVEETAPGVSVEEFVAARLGVDPARYFAGLRAATLERLVAERVARAWVLSQESRFVRLMVVREEEAPAILEQLEGGADLASLAREHSLDDTAAAGGAVPYLVETEGSVLAQAAFTAEGGELVGPLRADDLLLFLRVEEVRTPISGTWTQLAGPVEDSLRETPLADAEYVPWKLAMERTWPVDLRPLGDLLGARE